jgi:hypothetical protein
MLLDPRPGSLAGSSHVPGSGFGCDVGGGALAAKGLQETKFSSTISATSSLSRWPAMASPISESLPGSRPGLDRGAHWPAAPPV